MGPSETFDHSELRNRNNIGIVIGSMIGIHIVQLCPYKKFVVSQNH